MEAVGLTAHMLRPGPSGDSRTERGVGQSGLLTADMVELAVGFERTTCCLQARQRDEQSPALSRFRRSEGITDGIDGRMGRCRKHAVSGTSVWSEKMFREEGRECNEDLEIACRPFEVPVEGFLKAERFQVIGLLHLLQHAVHVSDPMTTCGILEHDLHAWTSGTNGDGPVNAEWLLLSGRQLRDEPSPRSRTGRPGEGRTIDDRDDRNDKAVGNLARGVCERHPNPRAGITLLGYPGSDEFGLPTAFFRERLSPSAIGSPSATTTAAMVPTAESQLEASPLCTQSIGGKSRASEWIAARRSPRSSRREPDPSAPKAPPLET